MIISSSANLPWSGAGHYTYQHMGTSGNGNTNSHTSKEGGGGASAGTGTRNHSGDYKHSPPSNSGNVGGKSSTSKCREFHPECYGTEAGRNNNMAGPIRDLINPIGNIK
mmetsp:Transcript_9482/g.19989  ORF Transcript_9482/g.19989 Transcript_9482/m.19989 type:complete len:109 (+) Transcript_9482:913-1239(+)